MNSIVHDIDFPLVDLGLLFVGYLLGGGSRTLFVIRRTGKMPIQFGCAMRKRRVRCQFRRILGPALTVSFTFNSEPDANPASNHHEQNNGNSNSSNGPRTERVRVMRCYGCNWWQRGRASASGGSRGRG